jgi:hypothetical protein
MRAVLPVKRRQGRRIVARSQRCPQSAYQLAQSTSRHGMTTPRPALHLVCLSARLRRAKVEHMQLPPRLVPHKGAPPGIPFPVLCLALPPLLRKPGRRRARTRDQLHGFTAKNVKCHGHAQGLKRPRRQFRENREQTGITGMCMPKDPVYPIGFSDEGCVTRRRDNPLHTDRGAVLLRQECN